MGEKSKKDKPTDDKYFPLIVEWIRIKLDIVRLITTLSLASIGLIVTLLVSFSEKIDSLRSLFLLPLAFFGIAILLSILVYEIDALKLVGKVGELQNKKIDKKSLLVLIFLSYLLYCVAQPFKKVNTALLSWAFVLKNNPKARPFQLLAYLFFFAGVFSFVALMFVFLI